MNPTQQPKTWHVDFVNLDLAEAIRQAQPGDTIELPAGNWLLEACLIVDKPLIIRGAGRDQTRLFSSAESFAVQFTGSGPWLMENLTIEHVGQARADVVVVAGGQVTIRQCRFTGAVFGGKSGESIGGCGIRIRGNARGLISECVCDCNGKHGIEVNEQAQPVLEGNTCENNKYNGMAYFENAGGTARNNTCRGNGHHGIGVEGQAQPVLEANSCENNGVHGLCYASEASGTVRNNTFRGNGGCCLELERGSPRVERNNCEDNARCSTRFIDVVSRLLGNFDTLGGLCASSAIVWMWGLVCVWLFVPRVPCSYVAVPYIVYPALLFLGYWEHRSELFERHEGGMRFIRHPSLSDLRRSYWAFGVLSLLLSLFLPVLCDQLLKQLLGEQRGPVSYLNFFLLFLIIGVISAVVELRKRRKPG